MTETRTLGASDYIFFVQSQKQNIFYEQSSIFSRFAVSSNVLLTEEAKVLYFKFICQYYIKVTKKKI